MLHPAFWAYCEYHATLLGNMHRLYPLRYYPVPLILSSSIPEIEARTSKEVLKRAVLDSIKAMAELVEFRTQQLATDVLFCS